MFISDITSLLVLLRTALPRVVLVQAQPEEIRQVIQSPHSVRNVIICIDRMIHE